MALGTAHTPGNRTPGGIVAALGPAPEGLATHLGFALYEHATFDGIVEALRTHEEVVVVGAYPIAVRALAKVLVNKHVDPAVVAIDERLGHATVLSGAHHGANRLARLVAAYVGAEPVVTTASDLVGAVALDTLPGLVARSIPAAVQRRINHGAAIEWVAPHHVLPDYLLERSGSGSDPVRIVVSDVLADAPLGEVRMAAPSLVVGVGTSTDATEVEVRAHLEEVLDSAGLDQLALAEVATIDRRAAHPAILGLGLPVRTWSAEQLAAITVPNPSSRVAAAVVTPSVAEAAALAAAGADATLVVEKHRFPRATIAIARRARLRGRLSVVGLGPGALDLLTLRARAAIAQSQYLVGYARYLEQIAPLVEPHHRVHPYAIGDEVARVTHALALAARGNRVALVTSGDPAVYAMAGLTVELLRDDLALEIVPGVSAALAASARTGALLGHDHAAISLSDLLTPWSLIEARLEAAARADLVIALYNPRSSQRGWQLEKALTIVGAYRGPATVALVAHRVERAGERLVLTTLGELDPEEVDMETVVIIGASSSRRQGDLALTPRGYPQDPPNPSQGRGRATADEQ